jgi:hypothetical protein
MSPFLRQMLTFSSTLAKISDTSSQMAPWVPLESTRVQAFDFKESTHHDSIRDPKLKTTVKRYVSGSPTLEKVRCFLPAVAYCDV